MSEHRSSRRQLCRLLERTFRTRAAEGRAQAAAAVDLRACGSGCEGPVAWLAEGRGATLHEEILAFAEYARLQRHEVAARRALIEDVRAVVLRLWPQGSLRVFGSFNANLSTFLSDVDLSITTKPSAASPQHQQQPHQQQKGNGQSVKQEEEAAAAPSDDAEEEEVLTWFTDRGPAPQAGEAEGKADESGASDSEDEHEEGDDEDEEEAKAEADDDDVDDLDLNIKGPPVNRKKFMQQQLQAAEEVKRLVEKRSALDQLARALRKCASAFWNVEFRRLARVPIVHVKLLSGLECDISVDESATDTSAFVQRLTTAFPASLPLAVVLKVFLAQQQLDKPFTGGIGSFRLYIMLAYLLANLSTAAVAAEGEQVASVDDLGTLLMAFFMFYSQSANLNRNTELCVNGFRATFTAVSQVDRCVEVFGQASVQLSKRLHSKAPGVQSFLASFISADDLHARRQGRAHACRKGVAEKAIARSDKIADQILQRMLAAIGERTPLTIEEVRQCRPSLANALLACESVEQAIARFKIDQVAQSKRRRGGNSGSSGGSGSSKRPRSAQQFVTEELRIPAHKAHKRRQSHGAPSFGKRHRGDEIVHVQVARLSGNGVIGDKISERFHQKKSKRRRK